MRTSNSVLLSGIAIAAMTIIREFSKSAPDHAVAIDQSKAILRLLGAFRDE